jgi:hypothetical protein
MLEDGGRHIAIDGMAKSGVGQAGLHRIVGGGLI